MAHSAGPWSIREISPRLFGINDAKGVAVADLHAIQGVRVKANAQLIAAAPDMLAALRLFDEAYDSQNDAPIWNDAAKAVKAVLRKIGAA